MAVLWLEVFLRSILKLFLSIIRCASKYLQILSHPFRFLQLALTHVQTCM